MKSRISFRSRLRDVPDRASMKFQCFTMILTILLSILHWVRASEMPKQVKIEGFVVDEAFGELHTMEKYTFSATREEYMYLLLGNRLEQLYEETDLIEQYLKDYEETSLKAFQNAIKVSENPTDRGKIIGSSAVLSHLMTHRFVLIVDKLRKLLSSKEYQDSQDNMEWALDLTEKGEEYGRIYNYKWPNEDDLHMSHISILHMQEIYGFSPWQFHKGLTIQSSFGGVLKALHCANIAQAALSLGYYYMAIEWLEFTHELLSEDETDDSISIEKVEKLLDEAVKTHNDLFTEVENFTYEMISNTYTEPTYVGHPANERLTGRQKLYSLKSRKYGNGSDWEMNNIALCSGKEFQPIEIRSKMKCYLERKRHPYFILNPVKVEQLSEHPYIVQMYDVLGNKTIEEHYNVRRGFMKLSEVTGSDDLKARLKHRTSASGSLPDCELSDRINKKSEMLTGLLLDDTTLEGLQVAEYTYGRFYSPHVDPLFGVETDTMFPSPGERMGTLLYYDILSFKLHEPDVGGFTPFTEVGIATPPILGSAVFWLNLYRNGTVRKDITHSACPVLHGHKIVFNRWIRYLVNFRTYKCSLNPLE